MWPRFFYGGLVGLGLFATFTALALFGTARPYSYHRALLMFGLATLLFDGDRLIEKVNFIWFVVWVPVGLALATHLQSDERVPASDRQPAAS